MNRFLTWLVNGPLSRYRKVPTDRKDWSINYGDSALGEEVYPTWPPKD